jgi:hypothetical protein
VCQSGLGGGRSLRFCLDSGYRLSGFSTCGEIHKELPSPIALFGRPSDNPIKELPKNIPIPIQVQRMRLDQILKVVQERGLLGS